MAEPKLRLNDLRRGIDEIDTSIHDLLIRRSALVEEIAEAKNKAQREAAATVKKSMESQ